jgi:hypothetical protein
MTMFHSRAICLAALTLACSTAIAMPAEAQNWGVQHAPPSWGLPAPAARPATSTAPPASPSPAFQAPVAQASIGSSQAGLGSTAHQRALTCAAALQLATLAAPSWAREPAVTAATDRWLQQAFATAPSAGISGDQVSAAVQAEMNQQAEAAAADPSALSRRAFDCATNGVG